MPRNSELHNRIEACKGNCVNPDATIQKHIHSLSNLFNIAPTG